MRDVLQIIFIFWFACGGLAGIFFILMAWPRSRSLIGVINIGYIVVLGPIGLFITYMGWLFNNSKKRK